MVKIGEHVVLNRCFVCTVRSIYSRSSVIVATLCRNVRFCRPFLRSKTGKTLELSGGYVYPGIVPDSRPSGLGLQASLSALFADASKIRKFYTRISIYQNSSIQYPIQVRTRLLYFGGEESLGLGIWWSGGGERRGWVWVLRWTNTCRCIIDSTGHRMTNGKSDPG